MKGDVLHEQHILYQNTSQTIPYIHINSQISIDASMKFTNMKSKLLEVSKNILLFAAGLKNRSSDVKILTNEFNRFQENNTLDRGIIQGKS